VGHGDGELDGFLRAIEVFGAAATARRLPCVAVLAREAHFAELGLAEPVDVALVSALPDRLRLLLRCRLQRPSSAPASSCSGPLPLPCEGTSTLKSGGCATYRWPAATSFGACMKKKVRSSAWMWPPSTSASVITITLP